MYIVKHRRIFYSISAILIALSIFSVMKWGLNFGIDFKGGSIIEVAYNDTRPEVSAIQEDISALNIGEFSVRSTGEKGYIIRTKDLSEQEKNAVIGAMGASSTLQVLRSDVVGPVLGKELQSKAVTSIVLVLIAIVLFITFAFRKISKPISSFKYGLIAIVSLIHDVAIPTGAFAYLGYHYGTEVDSLFITALLVVLGFSVHDTIVVFDRVRENLKHAKDGTPFENIVGSSINQTFTRSVNTSLTVLLSLVVLYVFGPEATHNFSLALLVGITAGTYSSIFIGSPLLVTLEKWQKSPKNKNS